MSNTPVIPGFFPDPSICRVGSEYFIVNSSFQYLPGVPLHSSSDLKTWIHVTNAYSRPEQLSLLSVPSNAGIYAPTIRHHDGVFYVVTSDLLTAREGHLIIQTEDPAGPWSDPVRTPGAIGIDPDLFWDHDGTCHLSWKGVSDTGLAGILSAPIDPATGARTGEVRRLWQGTGSLADPEGPHLYERDGYFYCLLAEGGTTRTHSVTIARSNDLDGPWEECPANPILTHRGTPSPVQNVGHADLVEKEDGNWAAVYLGVRPRGFVPQFHVNGRETFIADVTWSEGWPIFHEDTTSTTLDTSFVDTFAGPLDVRWIAHGGALWAHTSRSSEGLQLTPVSFDSNLPALSVRTRDNSWTAEAVILGGGALQVHMDTNNWAEVIAEDNQASVIIASVGIRTTISAPVTQGPIEGLIVSSVQPKVSENAFNQGPDELVFSVRINDQVVEVARFDGRLLSTEVTAGFTGRTIGVRATRDKAILRSFSYQAVASSALPSILSNPFES